MSSQYLTLYKMIVLYMLGRADGPLSKSQIYDFILEKEYTNFYTLQEVFSDLSETGLIEEKTVGNRTWLEKTKAGDETLSYFKNRINPEIILQIDEYFRENGMKIRNESAVKADYRKTAENEYTVRLTADEAGNRLVDISLPVWTESAADAVCRNWQKKNSSVYQYLIQELMTDEE